MLFKKVVFTIVGFSVFSGIAPLGAMSSDSAEAKAMAEEVLYGNSAGTRDMADAIAQGNIQGVEFWLDKVCPFYARVDQGSCESECINSAIIAATRSGSVDIVKMLIKRKAVIEGQDYTRMTVIMQAIYSGNTETVKLLLETKEDIEARDWQGNTALLYAIDSGHMDSIRLLLKAGADIEAADCRGNTALLRAVCYNRVNIVKLLLELKANVEARSHDGDTALIKAAGRGHVDVVKLLLEVKADIEARNNGDYTALLNAVSDGHIGTVRLLLEAKAHIEAQCDEGETALIIAACNGWHEIVDVLLKNGADITAVDKKGNTALMGAQKYKNVVIEMLLLDALEKQQREKRDTVSAIERAVHRMKHIHEAMNPQEKQDDMFFHALESAYEGGKGKLQKVASAQLTPTEVHINMFKQKIEEEFGEHVFNDPIVQKCIERERVAYQEGSYVFYRSEPGSVRVYEYFIEELYRLVHLYSKQHPFVFTRFFKQGAAEETIAQYVNRVGSSAKRKGEPNVLLSANIPLFGNIHKTSSCTWSYFKFNKSVEKINIEEMFRCIFDRYGFDVAYIKDLLGINGFAAQHASLQQIIVPKKMVHDVVMLAGAGYCVPAQEKLSTILDRYMSDRSSIDDAWQVRLLMNKTYGLNPESGIQFHVYTPVDIPQDTFEILKNRVKKLTDEIFRTWLVQQLDRKQLSCGRAPRGLEGEPLETVLGCLGKETFRQHVKQLVKQDSEQPATQLKIKDGSAIEDDEEKKEREVEVQREQRYEPSGVWNAYVQNNFVLDRSSLVSSFMHDCVRDKTQNAFIPQHYDNKSIARVATYNVHKWTDINNKDSYSAILTTIKTINPDVLVLQEVVLSKEHDVEADLKQMGYEHQAFMSMYVKRNFGTMIVSKYPFTQEPVKQVYEVDGDRREQRNFINTRIQLPNGKIVSVYGTHLDVWDETGVRRMGEVQELVDVAQKEMAAAAQSGQDPNVLLVADWNAVRAKDYQYPVKTKEGDVATVQAGESMTAWDVQTANFAKRVSSAVSACGPTQELACIPTSALEYIEKNGFQDSFAQALTYGQNQLYAQAYMSTHNEQGRDADEGQSSAVAYEECDSACAQAQWGVDAHKQSVDRDGVGASIASNNRARNTSPTYTVWTGTAVDFMFCSPTWNLPVAGSYVYYSTASDHLPIIMDIELQPTSWGFKPQPWLKRALKYMIAGNNT